MDGFQRRKEEKQARIYQAALELFGKYGVKNVKISEIAAKADVSPVTIYNYYGSKDGLLRQVIFQFIVEKGEEYSALIHKDIPFPEKIEKIIFNKKKLRKASILNSFSLWFLKTRKLKSLWRIFIKIRVYLWLWKSLNRAEEKGILITIFPMKQSCFIWGCFGRL